MRLVDSHCHLDSIDEDPAAVVGRAVAAGLVAMVTVGTDLETSRHCIEIAHSNEIVFAVVGVHPHEAKTFDDDALRELEQMASDVKVTAIGEIGLDYYRDHSPRDVQAQVFEQQMDLANSCGLGVVIHVRDALPDLFAILEASRASRFVLHCFSGDADDVTRALDLGAYISFAGNVSFKNAEPLREAARHVPLDRLMIETDSPYLAPMPMRGKPNEPAYVLHVAHAIAQAKNIDVDAVASATTTNAASFFRLSAKTSSA